MTTARRSLFLVLVALLLLLVAAGVAMAGKPTKVIILTFDQMRPEYAKQFDMTNLLWLQRNGANFKKAYVGHMASETVVSHNVIASGLFPKHMGWSDEVMRDVDNILGYGTLTDPEPIITVGDLSYTQFEAIVDHYGYPKLGDYMHEAFPGSKVAFFGEKYYQVTSMAASNADFWVTFSGKKNVADLPNTATLPWTGKYRMPDAMTNAALVPYNNVPDYILTDDRFKISSGNSSDAYGTKTTSPANLYPEDGRYAPGPYPGHRSGDEWVADAAIKVIQNEEWSALHLNFSGIDKIGHMWGGPPSDTVAWQPGNLVTEVHMAFQAKNADDQLGNIIEALQTEEQWDDTMIVVLADHASTWAQSKYYYDVDGGGNYSWYYDPNNTCANTGYGTGIGLDLNNEAVLAPLNVNDNLAYSYQSTAIEAWLIDQSWDKKVIEAAAMKTMPGVIATYIRNGDRYILASTNKMTSAERNWWGTHGQELVDTMAFAGAADVVGLLKDRTSYGVYGDHGGAQQDVQSIPMVFYSKGIQPSTRGTAFRLVDVLPTVLLNMGIPEMAPMDGTAYDLNIK